MYDVYLSKRKNKKYDVFKDNKYLLSFGDVNYEHYKDKFNCYSSLNHYDKKRRQQFRERFKNKNINNPNYPAYWSYHYLW
jgi:hypothetical protein